jgi:hypothetical protein
VKASCGHPGDDQRARYPTCAQATYHFCYSDSLTNAAGAPPRVYNIDACSPDEAEDKLLKQIGADRKTNIRPCH